MNGFETARNIADWLEGQLRTKAHEQIDRLEAAYNKQQTEQCKGDVHSETDHYQKVRKFMKGAGQQCPNNPYIPSKEIRELRAMLIMEEAMETIEALGVVVRVHDGSLLPEEFITFWYKAEYSPNLTDIVDGCCDIKVVTTGTLIACGVPDKYVQDLVDDNNLEKIEKGTIREDGKLIKPHDHQPPDIEGFLKELN